MPVSVPNSTYSGDGFHVSHNDHDLRIYGDVTTALVRGDCEAFYILNGDHRAAYFELIPQGFDACLAYFVAHIDQMNHRSERPPMIGMPEAPGESSQETRPSERG